MVSPDRLLVPRLFAELREYIAGSHQKKIPVGFESHQNVCTHVKNSSKQHNSSIAFVGSNQVQACPNKISGPTYAQTAPPPSTPPQIIGYSFYARCVVISVRKFCLNLFDPQMLSNYFAFQIILFFFTWTDISSPAPSDVPPDTESHALKFFARRILEN